MWGLRRFWDGLRRFGKVGTLRSPGGAEGIVGVRRFEGLEEAEENGKN